jgi:hypothetical protein
VSELSLYYLSEAWRDQNAPHLGDCRCDVEATWGYALHPLLRARSQQYQANALQFWKEAEPDIIATVTER